MYVEMFVQQNEFQWWVGHLAFRSSGNTIDHKLQETAKPGQNEAENLRTGDLWVYVLREKMSRLD